MRLERLQQRYGIEGKLAVIAHSGGLSSKDVGPVLADAFATVIIADHDAASACAIVEQVRATGG